MVLVVLGCVCVGGWGCTWESQVHSISMVTEILRKSEVDVCVCVCACVRACVCVCVCVRERTLITTLKPSTLESVTSSVGLRRRCKRTKIKVVNHVLIRDSFVSDFALVSQGKTDFTSTIMPLLLFTTAMYVQPKLQAKPIHIIVTCHMI